MESQGSGASRESVVGVSATSGAALVRLDDILSGLNEKSCLEASVASCSWLMVSIVSSTMIKVFCSVFATSRLIAG